MKTETALTELLNKATQDVNEASRSKTDAAAKKFFINQNMTPRQSIIDHGEAVAQALEDVAKRHQHLADQALQKAERAREQAFKSADQYDADIEKYQKIADILDPPPPVTEPPFKHTGMVSEYAPKPKE